MREKEVLEASLVIERILTYGINLGDLTAKESEDYLLDLCQFINKDRQMKAVFQDNKVIIETFSWEAIAAVRIYKGTLQITPLSESNFFDSFMSVLGFITAKNSIKEFVDELDMEETEQDEKIKNDTSEFDWI